MATHPRRTSRLPKSTAVASPARDRAPATIEAKRYDETLCVNFARHYGLPIKVVRPSNNYGPGLKISDRRVLADFARDIIAGRDVVMLSDGSPRRTFCYVADAVSGYYKVLATGRPGEAYNIGVETPEVSVADVAERLVSIARDLSAYRGKVVRHASADRTTSWITRAAAAR